VVLGRSTIEQKTCIKRNGKLGTGTWNMEHGREGGGENKGPSQYLF